LFTAAEASSAAMFPAAFVFLSSRFSFSDLPDFYVIELRGDLSAMVSAP